MLAKPSAYKAGVLKSAIAFLREQFGAEADEVLAAYGERYVKRVLGSASGEFVEVEHLLEFNRALEDVLGRAGFTRYWKAYGRATTRNPAFRPLVDGLMRLFGSGRGLVKMLPRGTSLVGRNIGAMKVLELDADSALIEYKGFPFKEHLALFCEANRASIEGSLLIVASSASAQLEGVYVGIGGYRMRLRWVDGAG